MATHATLDEEQALFDATVLEIEKWWKTPRQAHIKRPYSAARIASLRGTLKKHYASSDMALKLWGILKEHAKTGTSELTFGATDPLVASQIPKYCKTVYVSGGLCGFSQVNEPGMDHADYPWDTVPNVTARIFNSQQWHDQKQHQYRMMFPKEKRAELEYWDYLTPLVADGDMGFNGLTATVKMTKAFVEAGVAMFHLDDLAIGKKKFTSGEGRTVIPFSEYEDRLTAARMQIDIMGAETMLMCRCDVDHAEYITDIMDPRDHKYVQGATVSIKSLIRTIKEAASAGGANLLDIRKQWLKDAGIMTFDEAVKVVATEQEFQAYTSALGSETRSLSERQELAQKTVAKPVFFDWQLSRDGEGQYLYKSCVEAIVERAIAVAPLGDVTWARMDWPVWKDMVKLHEDVRRVYPDRLFAFGYGGGYDWGKAGFSPEAIRTFPQDLAKLGVVWQVQPNWGLQGLTHQTEMFAKLWTERGLEGYLEEVQAPCLNRSPIADGAEKAEWCGAYLADAFLDTIAARYKKESVWTRLP